VIYKGPDKSPSTTLQNGTERTRRGYWDISCIYFATFQLKLNLSSLYDVIWVKINVYSKTSVYLWNFCYYTQIKIRLVTFFFTNKVCKKVRYQNTLSPVNRRFVINHIAQWKI
jgi:hypothetical protein